MNSYLFEVKSILRSILISSPVVLDVSRLNRDYKEQEGISIPFKNFGHNTLLEFLKSIPDVLLVDGDSVHSDVILINSEKSSHVNDLVMKQKVSSKPGRFSANNRRKSQRISFNRNERIPNTSKITDNYRKNDGYSRNKTSSVPSRNVGIVESGEIHTPKSVDMKEQNKNQVSSVTMFDSKPKELKEPTLQDNLQSPHNDYCDMDSSLVKNNMSTDLIQNKISPNNVNTNKTKSWSESKKSERKKPFKSGQTSDSQKSTGFIEMDVSLKASKKTGSYNYRRELGSIPRAENRRLSYSGRAEQECKNDGESNYFSRFLKQTSVRKENKYKTCETKKNSPLQRKVQNYIPERVQMNLQKLISDFPEGIYCSELPTVYKNLIGVELRFEDYGYMNLVYMCLDLNNIFHCVKESSSDYKLYDARYPLPQSNSNNHSEENSEEEEEFPEPTEAIPEIIWSGFESFVPEDAIKPGFEIEKIKVSDVFSEGDSICVTVADIYDISKFWIIIDYTKLDYMMDCMQTFYKDNTRYLVPRSLIEEGLCCVVLFREKFHRAVILRVMPTEDKLKVFYFDYGTLGVVQRSEVWFLTQKFGEMPRQAIRSRLCDICPPFSGVTWSPSAYTKFSNLVCMKKLVAEIERVDGVKNLVDIKLRNDHSYISDILVDLGHAIFINQTPKKHIEDPHCKPRVQYPHLFPTFEEIENWLVPSTAEADTFNKTSVTVDFLYSQYFSRTNFKDLIESIERKNLAVLKKKKSLVKQFKGSDDCLAFKSEYEINRFVYGGLYVKKTDALQDADQEQENNKMVQKEVFDIEDDGALIGFLRQKVMNKIDSSETKDILQTILDDRHSNNSAKLGSESNSSVNNSSFQKLDTSLNYQEMLTFSPKNCSPEKNNEPFTKLIDLDDEINTRFESSMNLLSHPEFAESQLVLQRSKNYQRCLLTDSLLTDVNKNELKNILDRPNTEVANSIPSVDLIHFDTDENVSPRGSNSDSGNKSSKSNEGSESGDADDEDSDSKLKSVSQNQMTSEKRKTNSLSISKDSGLTDLDCKIYSEIDLVHNRETQENSVHGNEYLSSSSENPRNINVQNDFPNNSAESLAKPTPESNVNVEHPMNWHNKMRNHELGQSQHMQFNYSNKCGEMGSNSGTSSMEQHQNMRVMPFAAYFPVPVFSHSRVMYPFTNQNIPQIPNIPIPSYAREQQQFLGNGPIHNRAPFVIFNYNILPPNNPHNIQ